MSRGTLFAAEACGFCGVGEHDKCFGDTELYPNSFIDCVCFDMAHTLFDHPDTTGRVYGEEKPLHGPVAEVDYDLEPYQTHRGHNVAKSKPRDDEEVARKEQARTAERSANSDTLFRF